MVRTACSRCGRRPSSVVFLASNPTHQHELCMGTQARYFPPSMPLYRSPVARMHTFEYTHECFEHRKSRLPHIHLLLVVDDSILRWMSRLRKRSHLQRRFESERLPLLFAALSSGSAVLRYKVTDPIQMAKKQAGCLPPLT